MTNKIAAMLRSELERQLDNPIWSCLATRHAHLALGDERARRYAPAISPLAGLPGTDPDNVESLAALTEIGGDVGLFAKAVPTLPASWATIRESRIVQMIRVDRSPLPERDIAVLTLGPADVPETLALVELTQPGPFRTRTIELGTYIGIRDGGRLVAMAGERMWVGDLRELSAVCTHPDVQRRGYARALTGRVVNRMLRRGQTPFLHVYSHNTRAIDVYLALGFVSRAEFPLLHARRVA